MLSSLCSLRVIYLFFLKLCFTVSKLYLCSLVPNFSYLSILDLSPHSFILEAILSPFFYVCRFSHNLLNSLLTPPPLHSTPHSLSFILWQLWDPVHCCSLHQTARVFRSCAYIKWRLYMDIDNNKQKGVLLSLKYFCFKGYLKSFWN